MGSGGSNSAYARVAARVVAAAAAATSAAHASPWGRPDGEFLIVSRAEYFRADLGASDPGEFRRFESNTYLEFGVTDAVTIGGKAIYGTSWLTDATGTQTASGFSEIEGFAQYRFLDTGDHVASARLAVARPAAFQSGARANLQSDSVDAEAAVLYGRNLVLKPVKIFAAAEAGYRLRFGDAADEIRTQATIGAEPGERWLFLLESFATVSMRNEDAGGADYDVVKIQPSLVYRFSRRWTVQAGMTEEIAGRNLALGRTFFIGLWSAF